MVRAHECIFAAFISEGNKHHVSWCPNPHLQRTVMMMSIFVHFFKTECNIIHLTRLSHTYNSVHQKSIPYLQLHLTGRKEEGNTDIP